MDRGAVRLQIALVLAALIFSALAPFAAQAQDASEKWTFMVYMSGDSSLDDNMAEDIREMQLVGSSDMLDIIVLTDSSGYSDTRLIRVEPGGTTELGLGSVNSSWAAELDLGEPETLSQFVIWAARAYPADRYMLDLWGHGNGWPGVCPDKGNYLDAPDLSAAFGAISATGLQIDIVSLDACQMGMLEIAYEIRGSADYALLSQKDIPVAGWPYDLFLGRLAGNGTVAEKGAAMIDDYMTWGRANSYYSLTLALIDLSRMDALAGAVDNYSAEAITMAGYFNTEFASARGLTEKYDGNAQYDTVHLLENIDNETQCMSLRILADGVRSAVSAAVVHEDSWSAATDPEKANHAHGLSVWFPMTAPGPDYLATSFAQDTQWDGFLAAMAPYFRLPGRIETPYMATVSPLDSDGDGLLDSVRISHAAPGQDVANIEVYGPDSSLFADETVSTEGTTDIPLGAFGAYQVAVYLRDANRTLLNYSLFAEGLVNEGLSVITGRVQSDNGRGQRWVQVALLDADGEIVKSTVTDTSGRYRLEVVIPTDTDGVGLRLECGLGPDRMNMTVGSLEAENVYDFILESGIDVKWIVRAVGILNLAGISCIVYWAAWGREKRSKKFSKSQ